MGAGVGADERGRARLAVRTGVDRSRLAVQGSGRLRLAAGTADEPVTLMPTGLPEDTRRLSRGIIAAASLVMLLLLTDGRPWTLFSSGAFTSDFYDAQAESLTHGRLAVDPSVASIEGIVQGDETHFYYGIFLALVRVPVALVTDSLSGQLTRLSILLAYALALVLTVHLAHAGQQLVGREPDDRDRWRVAVLLLAVAASPALFTFGYATVYHETELWAFTLALAALVGAVRLVTTPERRWAYGAAVACSLCTMTRASVGAALTGAVLVALVVAYRSAIARLIGPALVAVAGVAVHAAVNTARFGGAWNLPLSDQVLTGIEPARARWFAEHGNSFFGAEFVPSNLLQYLRPDALRIERVVPFVRYGPPAAELNGIDFESNTPATSLTVAATLLLLLAVAGVVWAVRERRFAVLAMVAATAAAGLPTLAAGFVANRYLVDFLPALALAAALAVWLTPPGRLPVRGLVVALVAWGALVNASLGVWSGGGTEAGFVEGRFRLDERLFDGPAPGVARLADITDRTPFGTVVVDVEDGRCHGVYAVAGKGLTMIERSAGDRMVAGTARPGDARLVDNAAWTLDLEANGDVVYRSDDDLQVLATVDPSAGTAVDYTVVADPVTQERYGLVDGTMFHLPQSVLDGPPFRSGAAAPGPLCRLMTERLGDDLAG